MTEKATPAIQLFWALHLKLYQWSAGRIGATLRGLPVLLLTTRGRKTGQARTRALMYLPYGEAFVVVASNLGQKNHPAWWLNLQADPQAEVQVRADKFQVRAREAQGQEREHIFQALAQSTPDYEQYRNFPARRIPLVVLEKQGEPQP